MKKIAIDFNGSSENPMEIFNKNRYPNEEPRKIDFSYNNYAYKLSYIDSRTYEITDSIKFEEYLQDELMENFQPQAFEFGSYSSDGIWKIQTIERDVEIFEVL